jgi:hypothetical protein
MLESRRSLIKRALLLLGGAAGIVGGRELLQSSGKPLAASSASSEIFVLRGSDWHIYSDSVTKGRLPTGGERMFAYGELLGAVPDEHVGDFYATYFSLHRSGNAGRLASLEHHTFNLPDGSIMGTGTTKPGLDTEDEFAIVGGTGRFAGVRGTYLVQQSYQEFGGDGTATFTFRIMTEADSYGIG